MKFQTALLRAAQGDRITNIAARGTAVSDEMDDMRAACSVCDEVLHLQFSSPIGDRVAALLHWMETSIRHFEAGSHEIALPLHLQQTLRDIGEELRDTAEDELDRLALLRVRRMLRVGAATKRDRWALQRVSQMVEADGLKDPSHYADGVRELHLSVHSQLEPVKIDEAAADELLQVLQEFA
jgi:hypothetical protein